jgi:hypothetical protein
MHPIVTALHTELTERLINAEDFYDELTEIMQTLCAVISTAERGNILFKKLNLGVPFSARDPRMTKALLMATISNQAKPDIPTEYSLFGLLGSMLLLQLAQSHVPSREEAIRQFNKLLDPLKSTLNDMLDSRETIAPYGRRLTEEEVARL